MKTKSIKLSNNLLQMKFMKKTAIETQEQQALEEQINLVDDEHWYLDAAKENSKKAEKTITVEQGYTIFAGIVFGRMSFNGFNPQIEKLNKPEESKPDSDEDKDVVDEEMAKHFNNKSRFYSKKNQKKVKRLGN